MEIKYDTHVKDYFKCIYDQERMKVANRWMNVKTLHYRRMHNMLSVLKPFINGKDYWLTLGEALYKKIPDYKEISKNIKKRW